ncbi:DUF4412 domain-containing protein [Mucilaginibacter sp. BJC16-A38]|uniref:DUF4412 domain-containing protein n=1 Tax=Mucilaginibacter phenanthrenivorans TaxID=1234842 RepID=UPI0021573E89|nr:DUF4412 domain-containing protein [Mucilaginibacter phenanthrenivorans]MCR8560603.1 DUF4412 domain-containing protein [Mucilaginibacter phenanthrenivorans]
MNIKFFNVALGIALTAATLSASAQKTYTQGVISLTTDMRGQPVEAKGYFTADSLALAFTQGPASIKILKNTKNTYVAILVDVPVASIKKAAIASPAEIEEMQSQDPKFTFAPTTETKQISGFNCKKVIATDAKGAKFDVWITNDVTLPAGAIASYYANVGGTPIQYTSFSQGQSANVTVTGIAEGKAPANTFTITSDFEKITLDDLKALGGG